MPIPTPEPPVMMEWRCFHCDEVFTDKAEAREHFGDYPDDNPACLIKGEDGGLLKRIRELEAEVLDAYNQRNAYENDARLWHEAEAERKRLQGRYQHGRDTSWFMFLDSLEGDRLVLTERAEKAEVLLLQRAQEIAAKDEGIANVQSVARQFMESATEARAQLTARAQEIEQVKALIRWLLGEEGDFPLPPERVPGKVFPLYWWRSELRERFNAMQHAADAALVSRAPQEPDRCEVRNADGVQCSGLKFHAESMNATPHTFAALSRADQP